MQAQMLNIQPTSTVQPTVSTFCFWPMALHYFHHPWNDNRQGDDKG